MIIAVLFYVLLPLAQTLLLINLQMRFGIWGGTGDMLNFISSVFAYHWLQANAILAAKIPWLQRILPYDRRIRLHIAGTGGIVSAVLYHGLYKTFMGYHIDPLSLFLAIVLALMLALSLLWVPLPGFKKLRAALMEQMEKTRRSNVSYDRMKAAHSLLALSLSGIILIHVILSGSFPLLPVVSRMGYAILFITGSGLMILSKTALFSEKGTVEEIQVREEILTMTLSGSKSRRRKAGQFAFLGIPGSGSFLQEHPFSYLNDGEGNRNRFAVRLVGPFTRELSRLNPGDILSIRGGFGNFRPSSGKPVCLIGSGIGIVPLISLLEEWDRMNSMRKGEVFLSVNRREDIPRYEELPGIMERNENIRIHFLIYEENPRLFDRDYFCGILEDPKEYRYYICSSPGVRSAVLKILKSMGIRRSRIIYEAFSFG